MLSRVWFFATPWTVARQAPLSMGFFQARMLEWVVISCSRGSSQPRDRTHISRIGRRFFTAKLPGKPCSISYPFSDGGFPRSSVGKESDCNAGDPGLIPGSGRSAGEGIGYPLQYSWASLVAQLVMYPPAMWETWVRQLDWEDPLEKGMATHSSILASKIAWTIHEVTKSYT